MRTIVCAPKCLYSHGYPCLYCTQCMFMKGMNPEWEKEIKERIGTDYKGYVVVCARAKPVSLIGQMSCVHYKGGTLVRWEGVSPGIRSVGRQSARPQGGLSGWLTGMMERMCHAEHVCALKSHLSQQPAFRHKHVQRQWLSWFVRAEFFQSII